MTPAPLLETKFYLPRSRNGVVSRPRLRERLEKGRASKLLLVSAPPGFGKTTLLADWLASGRSVAWLSLDPGDNDRSTFWTYVVAAIRTAAPEVGASELALLQSPQPPPIQSLLTTLLNELGRAATEVVVVLDDYHLIESNEVHSDLEFLLAHAPPQLHLVIASRSDPPMSLAGLRARGELVEIRAADLRFTADEAASYLNGVMGLSLTPVDVSALEGRTEGWIAALQLAALSVQGRDDTADFIAGFAGDDRYVVDYLVEEVLQQQSEQVQDFLMQTSILDRLSGPLCDAVTGQAESGATLASLDRGNLFLVPLDDRRRWYRYHHLFADVLRARLLDEQAERLPELHRRASAWHEQNGELSAAIGHALAAEEFERAADLVERAMPATRRDRQEALLRGWIAKLPGEVVRARPALTIGYVGALLSSGRVEGVERLLQDAEDLLTAGDVAVDAEELRRLPGWIAVYRAGLAMAIGDVSTTMSQAQRAVGLLDQDDDLGHGAAAALIGLASWAGGDLEAAHTAYTECTTRLKRAGHIADVLGCSITLADIRVTQGRLQEAMRTYEQALQLATGQGGAVLRGTADMYVGMSALHRERGNLELAALLLQKSEALGEHTGLPQNAYRWRVAMSRVREAEGQLDSSLDLLDEADRLYVGDFLPNVRPVPASRARVWIAQGRLADVHAWAREQDLSTEDELSYVREFEHVTLARALLAQCRNERAELALAELSQFLERLLHAAEAGARLGTAIEILVLAALTEHLRGNLPAALVALERALELAEPEGYLRVFVDEGSPMSVLLEAAARQRIAPRFVGRLLTALAGSPEPTPSPHGLVEPLSPRERDVLRLLGSDLAGPDIARDLTLSLNTVRTHTRNVYAKLGVNNRRAAVRRAAELGLLSRSRNPGS